MERESRIWVLLHPTIVDFVIKLGSEEHLELAIQEKCGLKQGMIGLLLTASSDLASGFRADYRPEKNVRRGAMLVEEEKRANRH